MSNVTPANWQVLLQHLVDVTTDSVWKKPYWEDVFNPDFSQPATKLNSVKNAENWIMADGIPGHIYRIIDVTPDTGNHATHKKQRYWVYELKEITVPKRVLVDEKGDEYQR